MAVEKGIEDYVISLAGEHGWLVRKVSWPGRRGAPDRLFVKAGRVVFIEFKSPGKKPRGRQANEIREMREAGLEVYVVDGPLEALEILGIENG